MTLAAVEAAFREGLCPREFVTVIVGGIVVVLLIELRRITVRLSAQIQELKTELARN